MRVSGVAGLSAVGKFYSGGGADGIKACPDLHENLRGELGGVHGFFGGARVGRGARVKVEGFPVYSEGVTGVHALEGGDGGGEVAVANIA